VELLQYPYQLVINHDTLTVLIAAYFISNSNPRTQSEKCILVFLTTFLSIFTSQQQLPQIQSQRYFSTLNLLITSFSFHHNLLPLQTFASRNLRIRAVSTTENQASTYIPAAPIFLPQGPWKQVIF